MDFINTAKVRDLCIKNGLNGHELAAKSGIGYQTCMTMYDKPYRPYKPKTLQKLAEVFKVDMEELTSTRMQVVAELEELQKKEEAARTAGRIEAAEEYRKRVEGIKKVL